MVTPFIGKLSSEHKFHKFFQEGGLLNFAISYLALEERIVTKTIFLASKGTLCKEGKS